MFEDNEENPLSSCSQTLSPTLPALFLQAFQTKLDKKSSKLDTLLQEVRTSQQIPSGDDSKPAVEVFSSQLLSSEITPPPFFLFAISKPLKDWVHE